MRFKKISKRFAAAMLTGIMMVSMMGMTAFAKTGDVKDGIVTFTKTLVKDDSASVPEVTFTYTIAGGTAVSASANNPEILSGGDSSVTGLPTVGSAVYAPVDDITTEVNETALVKTVNVDFSNVVFTKPGIYRYVITESATTNEDITNDSVNTRVLDVYVVNNGTNGYKIASQALLKSAVAPSYDATDANKVNYVGQDTKSNGFTNTYTTYSLSLKKNVAGDMGNHGETFKFTIDFEGPANASFSIKNSSGTYEKYITLDADGKATTGDISLKESDKAFVIYGIPSTVKYTINEVIDKKEGYTTTYTVNSGNAKDMTFNAAGTTTSSAKETMAVSSNDTENDVVVTNTKNAITPTGIALTIAPYILMVALAGVFAVLFLRRRKNEF